MKFKRLAKIGASLLLGATLLLQPITGVTSANSTYKLNNSVNGYVNASNAKNRTNAKVTYKAGSYYVYKKYAGMLNISKNPKSAGAWINPADNRSTSKPVETIVSKPVQNTNSQKKYAIGTLNTDKTFTLSVKVYGYVNANDAKNHKNNKTLLEPGKFYVYKTYNGMINLSRSKGSAGSWVNPSIHKEVKANIPQTSSKPSSVSSSSPMLYSIDTFKYRGVINWKGMKFTWYSQKVLPGYNLNIPGRHVNKDGYVADKDGYIVIANDAPKGTVINTPFGYQGKVYDRGTYGNHMDVYVD